ncbi:hypothetical protein QBC46DRAFT_359467, partial [Diplogelasinospora grovesii]
MSQAENLDGGRLNKRRSHGEPDDTTGPNSPRKRTRLLIAPWGSSPAAHGGSSEAVHLGELVVVLELPGGGTFVDTLTRWSTRERRHPGEHLCPEDIDADCLIQDLRAKAGFDLTASDLVLAADIGRPGVDQKNCVIENGGSLRRVLMNACRLGLSKSPEFGDWVLPFRFIRHHKVAVSEADGVAIRTHPAWSAKQQEQEEPGARAASAPDNDTPADSQAGNGRGSTSDLDPDIYGISPRPDRTETGATVEPPSAESNGQNSPRQLPEAGPKEPRAEANDIGTVTSKAEGDYHQSDDHQDGSDDEPLVPPFCAVVTKSGKDADADISGDASRIFKTRCEASDSDRPKDGQQDDVLPDLDNDSDVQYLFERSSVVAACDQAEPGSYGDGLGEEGDECDGVDPLRDLRAELRAVDDLERWAATCQFFCHDEARTAHDQGVKLLGTTLRLRPHQMEAVYALLQRSFGGHLDGGIVALDTGLGKTIVSLAAVAAMRLVELNWAEVRRERARAAQDAGAATHRRHNNPGIAEPCPSGNPWSIECCCVAGSLGSKIAHQLGPGPSFVLTPSSVAGQFAREAARYLDEQVGPPRSDDNQCDPDRIPFVDVIDLSTHSTLTPNVRNDILTDFVRARPVYAAPKKGHQQAAPPLVPGSGSEMGYTPDQVSQLLFKHRLIVISSSPTSLSAKGGDRNCFAQTYNLEQQQRKSSRPYLAAWAVAPRFVILDEFHLVKDKTTVVYKTLHEVRSRVSSGNRFKLAALSATPISVSLQRSLNAVLSLIVPPDQLDLFYNAAQTIDLAAKTGVPKDVDRYNEAIGVCCDLLKGVMTLRTTTDLFHGEVLLPLPALNSKRIPCKSARASEDDFQRKVGELTTAWRQAAYAKLKKQSAASDAALQDRFFQFARFNSSFTLTLWLASFPGIVDLPDELSSNPGAWLNRDTMDDAV